MELKLKRIYKGSDYTIGRLYIDEEYFCDTLEDTDRGLTDDMTEEEIKDKKIYGETSIPYGTYKITMTYSPKFKRVLPLINNIKGFDGIRIHNGNSNEDTLGCILVGYNKIKGKVINSRIVLASLINKLNLANNIIITIE